MDGSQDFESQSQELQWFKVPQTQPWVRSLQVCARGNCLGEQRLFPELISHKQQESPSKHSLAVQTLVPVLSHFPPGRSGLRHSESNPSWSGASCFPGALLVFTISFSQALSWRTKGPCSQSLPFLPRPMRDCSQTPVVPQGMAPVFHHNPFQRVGLQLSQHAAGPTQLCPRTSWTLALLPPALETLVKTLSAQAMVFHASCFFYGCILSSQKQCEFCPLCWIWDCILRFWVGGRGQLILHG